MSLEPESGKDLLRTEFQKRIREAIALRDWSNLEHWSKQWMLIEPHFEGGFKWLARASVALNKHQRAAYAYGRLLDFEPNNEEAKKFFGEHPSALANQPQSVQKAAEAASPTTVNPESLLTPDQRRLIANAELELAQNYEKFLLFAEASARFKRSFDWQPSQAAALGASRSLHKSERGLEAIRFLREQVNSFPDWVEGRLLLARIHMEIGQKTEAQAEWQRILRMDPANREALAFLRALYTST